MTTAVAAGVPVENLRTVLGRDLAAAHKRLAQARQSQRDKDTPVRRAAVAEAGDLIDRLLDMYLEIHENPRSAA